MTTGFALSSWRERKWFVTVNKLSLVAKGEVYSPAAMGSLFTVAASLVMRYEH